MTLPGQGRASLGLRVPPCSCRSAMAPRLGPNRDGEPIA